MRMNDVAAGLEHHDRALSHIAILENSSAEHDLLLADVSRNFHDPVHQRIMKAGRDCWNRNSLALIVQYICNQGTPVTAAQRIRLFGSQSSNFIFEQHRSLTFKAVLMGKTGDRSYRVKEPPHAGGGYGVDAAR